jgi:hypothetical protein
MTMADSRSKAVLSKQSTWDLILQGIVFIRGWLRPDIKLEASRGEVRAEQNRLAIANDEEATAPTGLFLRTMWARDSRGSRRAVKIELVAGDYRLEHTAKRRETVDLILSVGATVRPGCYIAVRGLTAIQIRVKP